MKKEAEGVRYYYLPYLVVKDNSVTTGGVVFKGNRRETAYLISGARKRIKQELGATPAILGVVRISKKDYEEMQRMDKEMRKARVCSEQENPDNDRTIA
jgi:hypothetical protein